MEGVYIHPTAVVDQGAEIGPGTRIWHFSHLMARSRIGAGCIIGQNVFIGHDVVIGNGVKIQNNVSVFTGVMVEDDAFLGPSVVFTNIMNPRSFIERKEEFRTTRVGRGASIGANATILCGITIGEYAMIGAGAVLTRPVKPFQLVYGNPATPRGWVSREGYRLIFNELNQATCPGSGETYLLQMDELLILKK